MKNIEEQIGEKFDKAYLDASLPVAALYEKLGFVNVMHERYPVENGVILAYEVMEKELHKISTDINLSLIHILQQESKKYQQGQVGKGNVNERDNSKGCQDVCICSRECGAF